jgi:NADH-quinone oxidoreductase subunit C
LKIDRNELMGKANELKKSGFTYLVKITAVDYINYLEAVYFVRNIKEGKDETIEVEVGPADAWVPTVMGVYAAADWYEREMSEMFGIEVKGRPVGRLLLEKWNGKAAPLRKNFNWGEPY